MDLADLRRQYMLAGLREQDAPADPWTLFTQWFEQATVANPGQWFEANAMTLATVGPDGQPSARMVLLKGFDAQGLVFFTNLDSPKGRQIAANPRVALVFYWAALERQVRVEGKAIAVSRQEVEAYARRRPRGSQLGALASHQSQPIAGRQELEERLARLEAQWHGLEVPVPDRWGGYRVEPTAIEFWQGRENRLHDRLRYTRETEGAWRRERLQP
ncbi:MAG: pyridoxamine 5'-phosphate oxidase [Phycisphaeraceae bacterium]|nr:pyridoxamine 5'-phosphate oxidase [Phycisphaeraceae bacterium]